MFDTITALCIMFRARAWAKRSEGGRILVIPGPPMPWLSAFFPSKAQMYQRVRIYLQAKVQQPDVWVRRASDLVSNPEAVGDEIEYQFLPAIEYGNPAAKAIYVHVLAVETVKEIVENEGGFADTIHPHWSFTKERIQILDEGCKHLWKVRNKKGDENIILFWL